LYAFYRKEKEKEKGEGEGLHLKLSNFTAGEMLFHKVSQRPFMTVGCQGASFGAELCKHHLSLSFFFIAFQTRFDNLFQENLV
jgi:hypothetical protein